MTNLSATQVRHYHDHGYLIVPGFFFGSDFFDNIRSEISDLGRLFRPDFRFADAAEQIPTLAANDRHCLYAALRYLPGLPLLAGSNALTGVSRQLGLGRPSVMHSNNIRMDMPNEAKHLFHWHQDITFLLGSANSLTFWLPFDRVDAENGSVAVIPGSHKRGLVPFRYTGTGEPSPSQSMRPQDIHLISEPDEPGEIVEADAGALIVFSQFLLHKSTYNSGSRVRWTAQIRHADLADPAFIAARYPFGEETNIFHHDYLQREAVR